MKLTSQQRLSWLNAMIRNLKEWRGCYVCGQDTSAIDSVIAEMEHYANVEAKLCELDLKKFHWVLFGYEAVSLESLNALGIGYDEKPN